MLSWNRILTGTLTLGLAAALPGCDHAEPELTLAETPLHLIIIEDLGGGGDSFASIEALDPSLEVWSQSAVEMVIEDEPEFDDGLVADDSLETKTRRFLLALAGTAGAADLAAAATAPAPTAEVAPAPSRTEAAPVRRTSKRAEQAEVAASVEQDPRSAMGPSRRIAALSGMSRTSVRTVKALEPHEIRQTIVRQLPKVRACYERTLKAEPQLRGRLVLSMKVQPEGTVKNARISDDGIGSDALSACVESAVSSWRFPEGTEAVAVDYPVTLKPGNGGW